MERNGITRRDITCFQNELREREKALQTIRKYVREAEALIEFLDKNPPTKSRILDYRDYLQKYNQARTVNAKLSAVNAFLEYVGCSDCKVRLLKVQRRAFVDDDRVLHEDEYRRLLNAAKEKNDQRLYHVMMTLCGTGIRVSELRFITFEAVKTGRAEIRLKGKTRTVILTKKLRQRLMAYAREKGIKNGCIFCTRTGKALDRSNICHDMKKLCEAAKVNAEKVFPHNLRHLFAKSYYAVGKSLSRLADILGHSSVETTRIYVAAGIKEHEQTLKKMRLII